MRRLLVIATAALLLLGAGIALASSHREAPAISKDPTADNTDVYAFVSPDRPNTVTLISNWIPAEDPNGGPNFYGFDDDALYYIIVDNVGDARDHIVFEFAFQTRIRNGNTFLNYAGPVTSLDDPDLNVYQTYTVTRYDDGRREVLGRDIPVAPNNVGPKSTPDIGALTGQAVRELSDGTRVFAGQRDDPFFVDLGAIFDLLTIRALPGNQGGGIDGLGGFNVHSIALQVPVRRLTRKGAELGPKNSIIGVYSTTRRARGVRTERRDEDDDDFKVGADPSASGGATGSGELAAAYKLAGQVSRLGSPLVNEVVIPLRDKDAWNRSRPRDDARFLSYVTDPEVARLLNALYGISVPPPPRKDLVAVFLTGVPGLTQPANVRPAEFLRLNMAIPPSASPNRLGVLAGDLAGFPNGRRLADDVVDIALRAVAGVLVDGFNVPPNNQLGDGVDFNDRPFAMGFPYLSRPHSGFEHGHHVLQPLGAASFREVHGRWLDPDEIAEIDAQELNGREKTGRDEARPSKPLDLLSRNPGSDADLQFTTERSARVSLVIYDVQGRMVRRLVDENAAAGTFRTRWDGRNDLGRAVGRGVYFARFTVDGKQAAQKKLVIE